MARRDRPKRAHRQSTLTQLDFISTPCSTARTTESIDSEDDAARSLRPKRKRRSLPVTRSKKRKVDSTLTQIGFLQNEDHEDPKDTQSEDAADSVPVSPGILHGFHHSDASLQQVQAPQSSPPPNTSHQFRVPATPKHPRIREAPSSQTPPSAVLSATPARRIEREISASPLEARSTKKYPSAANTRFRRTDTVQDSQYDEARSVRFQLSPVVARSVRFKRTDTVQDSQFDEIPLTHLASDDQIDEENERMVVQDTQAIVEQCTFDPAVSALDRDAARCGWTQLQANDTQLETAMEFTRPPDCELHSSPPARIMALSAPEEEPTSSRTSSPHQRMSQVSTVLPTQSSPHPPASSIEEITPMLIKQEQHSLRSDISLPAPPWTESEHAEWLRTSRRDANQIADTSSLVDWSLPPPPVMNWSSISSSAAGGDKCHL